jgi:hypothetical protein
MYNRAGDMKKLVLKATLQGIVNYINAYITPLALYFARVQRLSDDFFKSYRFIVYSLINRSGSFNITIKWERLTASREVGGYGLLDLEWYNRAALISWVFLIKKWISGDLVSDAVALLYTLSKKERLEKRRLMPIFFGANHYKSKCQLLDDISWASQGFETYWTYEVGDGVWYWNRDDSLQRKTFISAVHPDCVVSLSNHDPDIDSCMLFPDIPDSDFENVEQILFSKLFAITNSVFHIRPLSPHISSFIFKSEDLILTSRQIHWKDKYNIDVSDILSKLKYISLPTKTKYIFKDVLHLRLRTCYHKDICVNCNTIINGSHFFTKCETIKALWLERFNSNISLYLVSALSDYRLRYLIVLSVSSWLAHIFKKWNRPFIVEEYVKYNLQYDFKARRAIAFDVPYDFNNIDV